MDKINASYFKTHFGSVLDRASREAVRIERRGRGATILMPEEAYESMKHRAALAADDEAAALARLGALAAGDAFDMDKLRKDPRASAVLRKHAKHWQ